MNFSDAIHLSPESLNGCFLCCKGCEITVLSFQFLVVCLLSNEFYEMMLHLAGIPLIAR